VTTWFEIHSRTDEHGRVWLMVDGDLDVATVPLLRERLRYLEDWQSDVVLDLTAVAFLDSAAVHLLWALRDGRDGWRPALELPCGRARELLELTGIAGEPGLAA
jgi:anti-anti-sigma factor